MIKRKKERKKERKLQSVEIKRKKKAVNDCLKVLKKCIYIENKKKKNYGMGGING